MNQFAMAKTIDETKLIAFKDAILANPSLTDDESLEIIGESENPDDYHAALIERWPEQFDPDYVAPAKPAAGKPATKQAKAAPAPAAAKPAAHVAAKPAAPAAPKRVVLRNPDGTTSDLSIVRETSSAILVEVIQPKELVTIMLAGKPVEIDLIELRKLPGNTIRHGIPAATLIILGEASQ